MQALLAEAKQLIQDIENWVEGKTYHGVRTHKKAVTGPSWHSRTSVHKPDDGTFDEFWNCLGVNHSLNEKEYVPEVRSARLLGSFGGFEAWTMGYKFTPPISDRTFTILITCILEEQPSRQGYIISLPLDVSTDQALTAQEPQGVRGRYVSVERVREIDNKVEWIMATRSAPGGLIPSFLSESSMPSKISEGRLCVLNTPNLRTFLTWSNGSKLNVPPVGDPASGAITVTEAHRTADSFDANAFEVHLTFCLSHEVEE